MEDYLHRCSTTRKLEPYQPVRLVQVLGVLAAEEVHVAAEVGHHVPGAGLGCGGQIELLPLVRVGDTRIPEQEDKKYAS